MTAHQRFRFRAKEDLSAKIRSIGADIPLANDTDILFEPFILAGRRLPNRLAIHPMEGADATASGEPGELTFRRYQRFGAGGCGLIWFEAAAVHPRGRSNPHQLLLARETLDGFKRLVERTRGAAERGHPAGKPNRLLILQLTHSGRFSRPEGKPVPAITQRNPFIDPLHFLPGDYPLIPDAELDRLQEDFAGAAALAAEAGFDGVDIKACHGYLVAELLAARSRPDSRYGGPFENRARFLMETAEKVIRCCPGLLLACRLGVFDALPFPYGFGVRAGDAEAPDPDEPLQLVRALRARGLKLLNITAGIPAYQPHIGRPFNTPAAGGTIPGEHPLTGVARLLRIAAEVQRACQELPIVGTGYSWLRHFFPFVGAGVLKTGGASLIGLGRLAFAYPDFALDLRKRGRLDTKKTCVACSGCSTRLRAGEPAGCILRDKMVYGKIKPHLIPKIADGTDGGIRPDHR